MKIKVSPQGVRGNTTKDVVTSEDTRAVSRDGKKRTYLAIELMKLPIKERLRILASTAAEAEAIYAADKRLTDFEAFGKDDLYDTTG